MPFCSFIDFYSLLLLLKLTQLCVYTYQNQKKVTLFSYKEKKDTSHSIISPIPFLNMLFLTVSQMIIHFSVHPFVLYCPEVKLYHTLQNALNADDFFHLRDCPSDFLGFTGIIHLPV